MISLYRANHESLKYYSSITNTYYDELVRIAPLPPRLYSGLIFLGSSAEVLNMNAFLINKLNLKRGKIESINEDYDWVPVALEAGFKKVILCSKHRPIKVAICESLFEDSQLYLPTNLHKSGLYKIYGEKNGFLIVSLNNELDLSDYYNDK